jgi:hypothetical protein
MQTASGTPFLRDSSQSSDVPGDESQILERVYQPTSTHAKPHNGTSIAIAPRIPPMTAVFASSFCALVGQKFLTLLAMAAAGALALPETSSVTSTGREGLS